MQTVTMQEARAQLPELLEAAANGEPFQVEREGLRPVSVTAAVVSPEARPVRRVGFMEGQFNVPDDFDTMFSKEILEMFGTAE